jgi:hypothetical protein
MAFVPDRSTHSIERSDDAGQHAGQRRLVAKASIANKLARATVTAHFFLAFLVAIGREAVTLEDI